MKQCFDNLNSNWEEDITQETVDATAKLIKKQRSIIYMLNCKHKYKSLIKKANKETDLIKKLKLELEAAHYLNEYKYAKKIRSTGSK